MTPQLNRRSFLRNTGMAAAAFAVTRPWLNSAARTVSPNEKLNVAAIGFGGGSFVNRWTLQTIWDNCLDS